MIETYLDSVLAFHKAFKARICDTPDLSDNATNELRPRLIAEELHELRAAIEANNRVEILDALCDIQYVLAGAVISWGLRSQFNCITMKLAKVHDMDAHIAEMFGLNAMMEIATCSGNGSVVAMQCRMLQSKLSQLVWHFGFSEVFSAALAEVHRSNMSKLWTVDETRHPGGFPILFEPTDGGIIGRRKDGKIVKSPSYSPASLAQFI